jgi:hypothetical protein
MYMPRAPEGAGCVVVIMVVTVEIIRPSVRAMAIPTTTATTATAESARTRPMDVPVTMDQTFSAARAVIRPSVRAMAMLPLAALAAEKVWSMVTGTSMGLVIRQDHKAQ